MLGTNYHSNVHPIAPTVDPPVQHFCRYAGVSSTNVGFYVI